MLGLVVDRPARTLGIEPFFMQLISGIESALAAASVALLLQMTENPAEEIAIYRRWWAQNRVDGVILVDLRVNDPRVTALEELRMPAVVVGGPEGAGALLAVWSDDDSALCRLVHPHLSALTRDIAAFGAHDAQRLLDVVAGRPVADLEDAVPRLLPRGSTGPASRG